MSRNSKEPTPGALLPLRADPAVRAVVLAFDLREPFSIVTCYVFWPGQPALSGLHDYLAPLLAHHFEIDWSGSGTEGLPS